VEYSFNSPNEKKHEKKPFPIPKVYGKEEKGLHRIELNAIHV